MLITPSRGGAIASRLRACEFRPGRAFNLEVDIIARYLERLLLGDAAAQAGAAGVTMELLQRRGFVGGAD